MAGKKGAANVEFIMAFILFTGFLMAALYFFNPIKDVESIESSKNYLFNEFTRRASVELDSYSIVITTESDVTRIEVDILGVESEKNVRVEDYYGKELNSRRIGNSVCFEREQGENFAVVRYSEDFEKGDLSCIGTGTEYKIASSITGKLLSVKRMKELKESYDTNYEGLKEELGLPKGVDFSFSLELPNGEIINAERKTPVRVEIYSEVKIKEVLKEDGTSGFAYLKISTW